MTLLDRFAALLSPAERRHSRLPALPAPTPPRDEAGRFISAERRRIRAKAAEMARNAGRFDLAEKLEGLN